MIGNYLVYIGNYCLHRKSDLGGAVQEHIGNYLVYIGNYCLHRKSDLGGAVQEHIGLLLLLLFCLHRKLLFT
jgi:hypothetical protein